MSFTNLHSETSLQWHTTSIYCELSNAQLTVLASSHLYTTAKGKSFETSDRGWNWLSDVAMHGLCPRPQREKRVAFRARGPSPCYYGQGSGSSTILAGTTFVREVARCSLASDTGQKAFCLVSTCSRRQYTLKTHRPKPVGCHHVNYTEQRKR